MSLRRVFVLLVTLCLLAAPWAAQAAGPVSPAADSAAAPQGSPRLIVELASKPLAIWSAEKGLARANGRLDLDSAAAKSYLAQLQKEQAAFVKQMKAALPKAQVSNYINEFGQAEVNSYQLTFNGMAVDVGSADRAAARRALAKLPGVKGVYLDQAYSADLYTSTALINAPVLWEELGGQENGGQGVKVASMDGGIHKDAPMFSGEGWSYPAGWPKGGLGLKDNNNGKIIASRAYFRTWDPPAAGEATPWPGVSGTSHGCHTSGIAAGNIVEADYLGYDVGQMSGVAPAAWLMSYRVFYNSVTGDGSFYTAEGIAALEDIVRDGADVVNNSWGGGPVGAGGEFDPLDQALLNASAAGVFVSMSAGNAGPGLGTTDHPSDDYIVVGATTTSGTLASGRMSVTGPGEVPDTLKNLAYGAAEFGASLPLAQTISHTFKTSLAVDPANLLGCNSWEGEPFTGKAALVKRGDCDFSLKVYNAQEGGAEFAIVYNRAGDGLINMAAGEHAADVTIPSIFIGQTAGEAMEAWYATNGDASTLEVNTYAFQAGNEPDYVVDFSSRGPGVGDVLKPDVVAPGDNILSQGYDPTATGEARHLGYGQASGTSMAAPHVAGAAALVRQAHPDWSNAEIKSALMSTAKYLGIYNTDGSPAQPLDMGAGRIDLAKVTDPGVILDSPSLSFGRIAENGSKTLTFDVTNGADAAETYTIATLYTGDGLDNLTTLDGFTVSPNSITLEPGASAKGTVTFDAATSAGVGDNQGFIVLDGETHDAHLPVWARVVAAPTADVLVIDNDASTTLDFPDYSGYYTSTLEALGVTYDVWDADAHYGGATTIPSAAELAAYKAVIYYTGDNYYPNGSFTVSTPLTTLDGDILTEYVNGGGTLIAMGQDMGWVLDSTDEDNAWFLYQYVMGGKWLNDSVTGTDAEHAYLPSLPIGPVDDAPAAFHDVALYLGAEGDGAGNQAFIDEISHKPIKAPDNPLEEMFYRPLLQYPGLYNVERGIVAMSHREQPSLERPGITNPGRVIYATFGLEGVSNEEGVTSRAELLGAFLNWAADEPAVAISNVTPDNASELTILKATVSSNIAGATGVTYRWDFGDGSDMTPAYDSDLASHRYETCGVYTVRVEATDSFGNSAVGSQRVYVRIGGQYQLFMPRVFK